MPCLTHTSWPLIICWRPSSRFSLTLNLLENPWNLKTNFVCELYLEHDACLASLYIDHVKVVSKHYMQMCMHVRTVVAIEKPNVMAVSFQTQYLLFVISLQNNL